MSITIEHMESYSDKEQGGPEGVHLTITDNEGNKPVTLVIGHSGDKVFIMPGNETDYAHNVNVGNLHWLDAGSEMHVATMEVV
jgi:hypothetical protein